MHNKPANHSDYPAIAICFRDQEIAYLFAELVEAEGYRTTIVADMESINGETHLITESSLIEHFPEKITKKCLVIGDSASRVPAHVVPLIRPLSEDKIDSAFANFLPEK